ncbi:hypothetical protein [Pseudobutyrivibrio sp.]
MTTAQFHIVLRVVKRRMANGEDLEDILASYHGLSEEDKERIRQAVNENG